MWAGRGEFWVNRGHPAPDGGRMVCLDDTHDLPADPVVGVVEGVAFPLKQLGEQGAQVLVVGLLEEVQAPHVSQVGGHLLCTTAGQAQVLNTR